MSFFFSLATLLMKISILDDLRFNLSLSWFQIIHELRNLGFCKFYHECNRIEYDYGV
jgi:hypothetical protein